MTVPGQSVSTGGGVPGGPAHRKISLSGDLGSGKTTVAREISERLGIRYVGSGDVQRAIAAQLGLSTLQTNLIAEQKASIDEQIDGELRRLETLAEPLVIDARMGWHFVPSAFKVHIIVAPSVGARRLLQGRFSDVEAYASEQEAQDGAAARAASERRRFQVKYQVDITRLRNYDLVVDASDSTPGDIAEVVIRAAAEQAGTASPRLFVSPRRVLPSGDAIRELVAYEGQADRSFDVTDEVVVGYTRPWLFVVRGHRSLSARLATQSTLSEVTLGAEHGEPVVGGMDADTFFGSEVTRKSVHDWESAHQLRYDAYPEFIAPAAEPRT